MASGFIVNTTKPALSDSAFVKVILAEHRTGTASDPRSNALPNASSMSQLDIRLTSWNGTATIDMYLTWDTGGDEPVSSKIETVSLTVGSTSSIGHTTVSLDKLFLGAPTGQTETGKVYLWSKLSVSDNTILDMARLHWHDKT
tara:strand:+ start:361 stop:789 length:429 start_codon:yes stop_codon:yes gene_type:complete